MAEETTPRVGRQEREVRVPFTLSVRVEFDQHPQALTEAHIPAAELALQAMMARVFSNGDRARRLLLRRLVQLEERDGGDLGARGSRSAGVAELLSQPARGFVVDFFDERLHVALRTGQGLGQLAYWSPGGSPFPEVRIRCETIELKSGSLVGDLKGFISAAGFTINLIVSLAGPMVADSYGDYVIRQRIAVTYEGELCTTFAEFRVKPSDLVDLTAEDVHWNAVGLASSEAQRRVCQAQIALDFGGHPPGAIDGVVGPKTKAALDAFAKAHNLHSGDINEIEVRRALARALHEGLQRLR